MNEWLDLMLEEISRKQRERREAEEELERRRQPAPDDPPGDAPDQGSR